MSVFPSKLVEITVECLAPSLLRCVHRGQGVSTVNCTSRAVPVTAAEIRVKENVPLWWFHLYFTQHRNVQLQIMSTLARITFVKTPGFLVCRGMVPHFLILIVQWFTILAWILESPGECLKLLILGPHQDPFHWHLCGKGPRSQYVLRFPECCQLYTSVNCCLYPISP